MRGRFLALALLAFGLSVGTDLLLKGVPEGGFWWLHLPGFFAVLGFVGCVALIIASKWLGHFWLQRPEDYFDDDDRRQ